MKEQGGRFTKLTPLQAKLPLPPTTVASLQCPSAVFQKTATDGVLRERRAWTAMALMFSSNPKKGTNFFADSTPL
jgi:hypothetical protein